VNSYLRATSLFCKALVEQSRILLDILESVDRDGARSQRSRASEVGIALGLTNAYIKFCIRKGYLKARKISARSYRYMLTPKGFAEKSRLAMNRLSSSLDFVRAVRGEYAALYASEPVRQWDSLVIVGTSTLAEICAICAMESGIRIEAIVDPDSTDLQRLGLPLRRDFSAIAQSVGGAVIAELEQTGRASELAENALGTDRVAIPPFLRAILPKRVAA
jgi:predicted transcriptional regulator